MNDIELLRYGIRKRASWLDKLFGVATKAAEKGTDFVLENAKASMVFGIPATMAMLAWLANKATSPKAVADNATEYAINATEKESLVQSIRDAEDIKLRKKLSGNRKRVHDQFL